MLFNSLTFLIFLPIVFGLYCCCRNCRQRNRLIESRLAKNVAVEGQTRNGQKGLMMAARNSPAVFAVQ